MRLWLVVLFAALSLPALSHAEALFAPSEVSIGRLEEGKPHAFLLRLKNTSGSALKIQMVVTSCGCMLASPADSDVAENGELVLEILIDTRGKLGGFTKTVTITTDAGVFSLVLKAEAFHTSKDPVDKSAIFGKPCSRCHSASMLDTRPANELYAFLCHTCHGDISAFRENKPAMTRDLLANTISAGLANTSMPGFSRISGGPLAEGRIRELADYILKGR